MHMPLPSIRLGERILDIAIQNRYGSFSDGPKKTDSF